MDALALYRRNRAARRERGAAAAVVGYDTSGDGAVDSVDTTRDGRPDTKVSTPHTVTPTVETRYRNEMRTAFDNQR